jgi:membrane-bound lytic murein transglycosylase D
VYKTAAFQLLLLIFVSSFTGCNSSSLKNQSVIPQPFLPLQDSIIKDNSFSQTVPQPGFSLCSCFTDSASLQSLPAESLVAGAVVCLDKGSNSSAHLILKKAQELMERSEEITTDDTTDSYPVAVKIALLYIERFPKEYLDSISPSLANLILRYQITSTLDTVFSTPSDSMLRSILSCENGAPYNIPITQNKRVNKVLYFLINSRTSMVQRLLVKAQYYLPMMRRLFSENNLPTDLTFLPLLESGFNPKAYSYAHASGIWQFIASTGARYGLRRNFWIDEARDPVKSTLAAIGYLSMLHTRFNDWYLALAAYNCGENSVERAITRCSTSNYWDLKLPRQTMSYVPLFISYQIVAKTHIVLALMYR